MSDKPATDHFPKIENQKTQENYDFNHFKLNVHHERFCHLIFENVEHSMDGHFAFVITAIHLNRCFCCYAFESLKTERCDIKRQCLLQHDCN